MQLIKLTTQAVALSMIDQQGAAVDLTGVTEVRFQAKGPTTIGPLACAVTDALTGTVSVPLTPAEKHSAGQYDYELEARWGATTRLTATGTLKIATETVPAIEVMAGDTPTFSIQVAGHDFTGAACAFHWGVDPAAGDAPIDGTLAAPGAGGADRVDVTLSAVDTAAPGTVYGRLVADGVSTGLIQITVKPQGLV